jgi:hypothetical protein
MMSLKSTVQSLAFALLVLSVPAIQSHAEAVKPVIIKPLQAFNLEIGAKRALGYFLSEDGKCDLTVMLSDIAYQDDGILPTASRVGFKVAAGTSAQVDTVDGQAIAFQCSNRADRMALSVFERLAFSPAAKW